jgi:hypothetical protein
MYLHAFVISEKKIDPLIFSHWQHTMSQSLRHVAARRVLFWDYVSKNICFRLLLGRLNEIMRNHAYSMK